MNNTEDYRETTIVIIVLLLFSIILTIIVNRISKKYRIENRDPLILRSGKKWTFKFGRDLFNMRSTALFFSLYMLMINVASYCYFELSYKHTILVIADIAFGVLFILIALAFMFRDVKARSIRIFNKLPSVLRIVIFFISGLISQAIHRVNVNSANL